MKVDSSDYIMYLQSPDIQILWSSTHPFHILALFLVIRGLAIAALPWMLDLWSARWTGSSKLILSSAVTCAAVLLWFLETIPLQCMVIHALSFGFWPLFLIADDVLSMICVCCHCLRNCCSGYTQESDCFGYRCFS